MPENVTRKLIQSHLLEGEMTPGSEIGLRIDQTLTQDATGTLVMLELEAMGLDRVRTELSVQYVDHNLIQEDAKNPDDHLFLESACRRFGVWYSRPGNGVSHPVHQERFGKPGKTLLGSDSHTPAAGSLGMLAIGAGGLEVALAMAGHPFYLQMPKSGASSSRDAPRLGEREGRHPRNAAAARRRRRGRPRDRVLRARPGVAFGDGSARDRQHGGRAGRHDHRFPSDDEVRRFLKSQHARQDWTELLRRSRLRVRPATRKSIWRSRAADRHAVEPRQRRARERGRRDGDLSVVRRLVGQSRLSRFRRGGRDREGKAGPSARLVRRQSQLAADPART